MNTQETTDEALKLVRRLSTDAQKKDDMLGSLEAALSIYHDGTLDEESFVQRITDIVEWYS